MSTPKYKILLQNPVTADVIWMIAKPTFNLLASAHLATCPFVVQPCPWVPHETNHSNCNRSFWTLKRALECRKSNSMSKLPQASANFCLQLSFTCGMRCTTQNTNVAKSEFMCFWLHHNHKISLWSMHIFSLCHAKCSRHVISSLPFCYSSNGTMNEITWRLGRIQYALAKYDSMRSYITHKISQNQRTLCLYVPSLLLVQQSHLHICHTSALMSEFWYFR